MHEKVIKDLLNDLDRAVNRLAWLDLPEHSKLLEEFVHKLEEKLLKEGMLE